MQIDTEVPVGCNEIGGRMLDYSTEGAGHNIYTRARHDREAM